MMRRNRVYIVVFCICMMCLFGACGDTAQSTSNNTTGAQVTQEPVSQPIAIPIETPTPTPEPTATPEPTPTPFPEYDINLMMVGDNLMHMGIVNTGKQKDGTYNYDFLFRGIEKFLAEAEIKMINQETIFGGNDLGFSGYPYFNSPTEIGDAMVKAGFNVVLHSSNHTADQKLQGILNCVEFWQQYPEVLVAGIYGEEEDTSEIPLLEIGDITFAVLNYTYGPNMGSFP